MNISQDIFCHAMGRILVDTDFIFLGLRRTFFLWLIALSETISTTCLGIVDPDPPYFRVVHGPGLY